MKPHRGRWCQVLAGLGLPVARTEVARFGDQTVLMVERFDRR